MAIVKMKKVRILGIDAEKDVFLNKLLDLGCVEITENTADPEEVALLSPAKESSYEKFAEMDSDLQAGLAIINKLAPHKTGLFSELNPVSEESFFNDPYLTETVGHAQKIKDLQEELENVYSESSAIKLKLAMLEPWKKLDIPLQTTGTRNTRVLFFTVPAIVNALEMEKAVAETTELASLEKINEDHDQSYYWAVIFRSEAEAVIEVLRKFGYSEAGFWGYYGTVEDNVRRVNQKISMLAEEEQKIKDEIAQLAKYRSDFETCIDRVAQEMSREKAKEQLLEADTVFSLTGWVPESSVGELTKLLDESCCAYELSDPAPDDDVPVILKNSKLVEPLNMVTEMYSLPAYRNIDPNPLIFPWFTLFFGIMYADLGYGLILLTLGIIGSKLIKKKGTVKYMAGLLILCGITTSICGLLFGSFFGDSIPVFCDLIGIEHHELWRLIDPLEQPMVALIGSVAIGALHLFVGMAIKAVILIRDGHPLDALFDVGSWWLLFAGIAVGVLGKGWYVAIAGAAALVLTQGRSKPTIPGKFISGLASLYDITSYLGDVLSYTRLMALMLAGSVIASVVNTLGSLTGSVVLFIIICVIGHLFNMAINIIGTFVHAARLQYLEFFGKFFEEGGRPFKPFAYKTKYTDIIKEEK